MMKRCKKLTVFMFMFLLLVVVMSGANMQVKAATDNTSYVVAKKKIWKVNRTNRKVTSREIKSNRIVDEHTAYGQAYGDYIYFISDILPKDVDEWYRWGYLCRVKKDGTGFKVLGKAQNFFIANNRIFYNRIDFTVKENYQSSNKITYMGIYTMRLNGTQRYQVIGKERYLVGAKGSTLYTAETSKIKGTYGYQYSEKQKQKIDFSEIRFVNYDTDGAKQKGYSCSWNKKNQIFYKDGMLYIQPSNSKGASYNILDLDIGSVSKVKGNWKDCDAENAFFQSTKGKAILKSIETGKQSNDNKNSDQTVNKPTTQTAQKTKVSYPVKIDEKHFPDAKFRKEVQEFDTNKDGKLSKKEAAAQEIDVNENVTYQGLEYFPRMRICVGDRKAITISDSYTGGVTVQGGPEGKKLSIKGGKNISALTISNVDGKQVEIVSTMPKVKKFTVYLGQISGVDMKKFPNVESIVASSAGWVQNDGKSWKLQGLKKLKEVTVVAQGTGTVLLVSDCPKLKTMIANLEMERVQVKNCSSLKKLEIGKNTKVSVQNCKNCKIVRDKW